MELPNLAALTLCTGTRHSHVATAAPQARSDAEEDAIAAAWLALHSGAPARAGGGGDADSDATQMDEEPAHPVAPPTSDAAERFAPWQGPWLMKG